MDTAAIVENEKSTTLLIDFQYLRNTEKEQFSVRWTGQANRRRRFAASSTVKYQPKPSLPLPLAQQSNGDLEDNKQRDGCVKKIKPRILARSNVALPQMLPVY